VRPSGDGHALVLESADAEDDVAANRDGLDGLRALCVAHWTRSPKDAAPAEVTAIGAQALQALRDWGLGQQQ
jgi:hypothetical protein